MGGDGQTTNLAEVPELPLTLAAGEEVDDVTVGYDRVMVTTRNGEGEIARYLLPITPGAAVKLVMRPE